MLATMIDFLDKLTIIVAAVTLCFTWLNWWRDRRGNDDIAIVLVFEDQQITLPQTIKRRHLTRSEVQGVLANAYRHPDNPKARYDIPFLASHAFSKRLEKAQESKIKANIDILKIDIPDAPTLSHFQH